MNAPTYSADPSYWRTLAEWADVNLAEATEPHEVGYWRGVATAWRSVARTISEEVAA